MTLLAQSFAQDCFSEFSYYREITLTATASQQQILSHTVAIPFNSKELFDNQKIQADGSDLRIVDSDCNELSFFITGVSERGKNIIYVSVPSIDESGITLGVYYGSTKAVDNRIDGSAVFEFFDDFEDGVVDQDKWESVGAYDLWDESDGQMRFTGRFGDGGIFQYVTPRHGFLEPTTFDFAANANNSQVYGICDTADIKRIGLRYNTGAQDFDTLDIIALMNDTLNGGSNPGIQYPYVQVTRNDINIISVTTFTDENQDLNFTRFENHSSNDRNLDTLTVTQIEFSSMRPFFSSFGTPIKVDFVGIRAGINAVPEIQYGVEKNLITSSQKIVLDETIQIFPNPAVDNITIEASGRPVNRIEVYNLVGIKMMDLPYKRNIDVSDLQPGHYLIHLHLENEIGFKKMIVTQ